MTPKPKVLNQSIPIRLNTKWGGLEKTQECESVVILMLFIILGPII